MDMKVIFKDSKTGEEKMLSNVSRFQFSIGCFWIWFNDEQEDCYLPDNFNQVISCEIRKIG